LAPPEVYVWVVAANPASGSGRRSASPVGQVLKIWRHHRRMSQLDLSSAAGVTPRHISFVETGRSEPSRGLLEKLANALDMPLRDRNDLHLAAGFAPPYRESGLDDCDLADAMAAIDRILESHEPLPAVVMDAQWNLLRTNTGALELFGSMLDLGGLPAPTNVLDLMFASDGLRPHVLDWDQLARALLARARRECAGGIPNPALAARLEQLARALDGAVSPTASTGPLIPVGFRVNGADLRFFSTVTSIGTALDVTLQELRVEQFHPANDAARTHFGLT
jgi:transcriptional regulator with XRE-family HTH domain